MGKLHTTTVRFDADTWADLTAEAERLGVGKAVYIREATQARIERSRPNADVDRLSARTERLERLIAVLLRR